MYSYHDVKLYYQYVRFWYNFETMSLVYVIWTSLENQVGGFAAMPLRFLLLWLNISYDICTPWVICRVFSQSRLQVYVSGLLHHHCLGNRMIENHVIVPKPVVQCWILWYVHQLYSPRTVVINFKKRITENCAYFMRYHVLQIQQ